MIIHHTQLLKLAETRQPGYLDAMLAAGVMEGSFLRISGRVFAHISARFKPAKKPVKFRPRGLGDWIALLTIKTGLRRLAKLYTRLTGRPCGCHGPGARQSRFNRALPARRPCGCR